MADTDDDALLHSALYRFADPGATATIQSRYVRFFADVGAKTVLDVGCGTGVFLGLLADAGIQAVGVDSNPDAIEQCRHRGHDQVAVEDAMAYLERARTEGRRFDGVTLSHLIEHFAGPAGVRLLSLACDVVAPGGRILVATPNVANLRTWTHVFWVDPTHVRPYPRALIEALLADKQFEIVASFDDALTRRAIGGWRGLLHIPRDVLALGTTPFRGGDSVVVGQRTVAAR